MKQAAPGDLRTRYLESLLAFSQGDAAKAKEPILEVLKVAPEHLPSRLLAAAIELELGQFGTAEDHLRRVAAAAPQASQPRLLLATAYLRRGSPRGRGRRSSLRSSRAEQSARPAGGREVALAKGDLARASTYYERATAVDKDNARLRTRLAQARFASGDVGQGSGLESASASDPDQFQADIALILAPDPAGVRQGARRRRDAGEEAARQPDPRPEGRVSPQGRPEIGAGELREALALKFDYVRRCATWRPWTWRTSSRTPRASS
jgi:tetratricopeptide (TPR) repeat protein